MAQIAVNNLTFTYEGGVDAVLENVTFHIDTNWKLGLIRRNGKGKTTLLNLLMGKHEYKGSISASTRFDYFPYQVTDDDLGRKCVTQLLPDVKERVYPVGRLDRVSEGALILTNDGEFANAVMHPSHHVPKTYLVTVKPDITKEGVQRLSEGIELDGRMTAPAEVTVINREEGKAVVQIILHEGRNREIRRMCEAIGLEVARLKRTAVGPVRLGTLPVGRYRELTEKEKDAILSAAGCKKEEKR